MSGGMSETGGFKQEVGEVSHVVPVLRCVIWSGNFDTRSGLCVSSGIFDGPPVFNWMLRKTRKQLYWHRHVVTTHSVKGFGLNTIICVDYSSVQTQRFSSPMSREPL